MTQQQQPTHTPEPWASDWGRVRDNDCGTICLTPSKYDDPKWEANKKRIVACINACTGLSDPTAALNAAREALESFLSIGKRDLTNPKYDGYFESLRAALQQLNGGQQP